MAIPNAQPVRCSMQLASPRSLFAKVRSASLTTNIILPGEPRLAAPDGAATADPADNPRGRELTHEGFHAELDGYHVDHKPAARNCKFIYLGRRRTSDAEIYRQLLVVEPMRAGTYRRVGRDCHWDPRTYEACRPWTDSLWRMGGECQV
ncbi:hypothetical protein GGTG_10883 [Gaeumannomyces tritici R3-111a-1]|uniref:Uncharacterized protein n=1 Tax=Gaeumannomyces tritici (strain R3-111a-1) TaxID=644352 RepID=J3PBL1_GAET3|nr:hypothetical protein GGTG_10883 [Gaeumannomyces tritici R3-111a-1]EJT71628.1 hypothetical protein GGTG_10883 [Gaeumannomyces tritici R3-111a-1]